MGVYRKKPVAIKAITFDEFVEYGKSHTTNIVNGMPWSFEYEGHPITHENDERYLIPTLEGTHSFTPQDMLITGVKGEIYPCKKDIFEQTYETVEITEGEVIENECGWCNKGYRFEFNWIDDNGNTITTNDNMVIGDVADFCPMCGKKLRT